MATLLPARAAAPQPASSTNAYYVTPLNKYNVTPLTKYQVSSRACAIHQVQGQEGAYRGSHPHAPGSDSKYGGGGGEGGGGGGGGGYNVSGRGVSGGACAAEPMDDGDWDSSTQTIPYGDGDGESKENSSIKRSAGRFGGLRVVASEALEFARARPG